MTTDIDLNGLDSEAAINAGAWRLLERRPGLKAIERRRRATDGGLTSELHTLVRQLEKAQATIGTQVERIAQLEAISLSDELTGLTNRRGFFNAFDAELDRCNRKLSSGGLLVLIDLDNFKAINDTFGHAAGDACLRLVGATLRDEVRTMDTAARLGGDEFVLLLCSADKARAAERVQTLAWRLNHLALAWQGAEISLHASVGIKEYGAGDCATIIFHEADLAMYSNKRSAQSNATAKTAKSRTAGLGA